MRIRPALLVAVFLTLPRLSAAQAPTSPGPAQLPRTYVDVNFLGYANPHGDSKTFRSYTLKFGEVATFRATYRQPSSSGWFPAYVGGGFMLNRFVAIGMGYSRISSERAVSLFADVPHPTFFNANATDTGAAGTLSGTESAIHISFAVVPVRSRRLELRLMGGPSFFTLKGEMVREIEYEQTFDSLAPQQAIAIRGMSTGQASGSAVGYHLGADLTYFFHRLVGIAGGFRVGQATVAVETEPLSNIRQEFLVGSTTAFLGLRVRFGPAHRN
jgi:hypothetical protein